MLKRIKQHTLQGQQKPPQKHTDNRKAEPSVSKSHSGSQQGRKSLTEEKGLGSLLGGQQRWGLPSLKWEGVPKSGTSNREDLLLCLHEMHLRRW